MDRVQKILGLCSDGVPNLDALDQDTLMDVWFVFQNSRNRKAARLIAPVPPPDGFTTVACNIGAYAANKATAMSCREKGNIQSAMCYEKICDIIYNGLPYWARW